MNNLKNIKNFEEFKDSVNEELLWQAIKDLFSKVFGKIDKKLADAVANFTKKLDGAKTWEESVRFYEEAVNVEKADMEASLKTVTGPLGLRKVVSDVTSVIFIQLQELGNKYQTAELAAKKIFEGNPMFQFDNTTEFNNHILENSNGKIIELNRGITPPPYVEKDLDTYLKTNTDINSVQPATTPAPAGAPTPIAGNIDQLKAEITKWLNEAIFGESVKKVKEVKAPAKVGAADAFDTIAKGSTATTLHPNLAKLLRSIVNIKDKAQLIKVRDAVAAATQTGQNIENFKKEMLL